MDRNFHTDDFERLLREKSEEFRMYPSKRIWYSIYNNIHPGRKWPSVAMSIILITTLLLVGYLNTKNTNSYIISGDTQLTQKTFVQTKSPQTLSANTNGYNGSLNEKIATIVNSQTGPVSSNGVNNNVEPSKAHKSLVNKYIPPAFASEAASTITNDGNFIRVDKPEMIDPSPLKAPISELKNSQFETIADVGIASITTDGYQLGRSTYLQNISVNSLIEKLPLNDLAIRDDRRKITVNIQGGNSFVEQHSLATHKKNTISIEDRDWIENYALYNRPFPKKWANKLSWEMYATPSVVYRTLYSDPQFSNSLYPTLPANSGYTQDINNAVNQKPSVGFEIGTGLQYSVFKGVKLKAGLQLNYTRYNSDAFQNTHPVVTKLMMHDYATNLSYEEYRTTPYSNKSGLEAVKLHNQTFEVSLPIGADIKLIGDENLQWNVGVTIQPTYVVAGKSYLISSDRRYYIQETSMLNKWNLNAGFETFLTYKGNNGITYQIGPQFRKQIYTTNNRKFAAEERLLNYGIKFGISKTLN